MRIEEVRAVRFGPFRDAELRLAPGMTVVFGPNEAGKSSWHAALYAGLCGMRRGRGMPRREDREFAERHRPWDGDGWEVGVRLRLDDGRRVDLHHDLDGLVDCRATDADLGRDLSAEIMYEGTPDGSRWLALDRRSFVAVACVRQADLLGILDDPGLLQEHLQRAAATDATDATAAAAIGAIDTFFSEHVGRDIRHSTRPLRAAIVAVEETQRSLEEAQHRHAELERLLERRDRLEEQAAEARTRLRAEQARQGNGENELFALARDLETPLPTVDPELQRRLQEATLRYEALSRGRGPATVAVGAVAAVAGAGAVLYGAHVLGAALLAAGVLALVVAAWRSAGGERERALEEVRAAEAALGEQRHAERLAEQVRERAAERARTRGLPADPTVLRRHADALRRRAEELAAAAAQARGEARQMESESIRVAEAEEARAAARAELGRVRRLERTLQLTRQFLSDAQQRVHHDIARDLADTIRPWLPRVTAGRYVDVRIDPESLEVRVREKGGAWRPAALLSHGTAEQVYLLLRAALARHLTGADETCPLILDDITVQTDRTRTPGVLALLHEISRERQVVLFTQEEEVLRWAESHLDGERDRIEPLTPVAAGSVG